MNTERIHARQTFAGSESVIKDDQPIEIVRYREPLAAIVPISRLPPAEERSSGQVAEVTGRARPGASLGRPWLVLEGEGDCPAPGRPYFPSRRRDMNKDELGGKLDNLKGRTKEAAGALTGNKEKEAEGVVERVRGRGARKRRQGQRRGEAERRVVTPSRRIGRRRINGPRGSPRTTGSGNRARRRGSFGRNLDRGCRR